MRESSAHTQFRFSREFCEDRERERERERVGRIEWRNQTDLEFSGDLDSTEFPFAKRFPGSRSLRGTIAALGFLRPFFRCEKRLVFQNLNLVEAVEPRNGAVYIHLRLLAQGTGSGRSNSNRIVLVISKRLTERVLYLDGAEGGF